jgi:phosphatidylserine decarboxylase
VDEPLLLRALRLVPKNSLSRLVGAAAHAPVPRVVGRVSVSAFARAYGIDVAEAEHPIEHYPTVGAFFTRRLRPGARAIDRRPGVAVSPADGHILNAGRLEDGTLLQAKGRRFTVDRLLDDAEAARRFVGGSWFTVYLSPRDYHRVHHPVEGEIVAAHHIPGHLWPVNQMAVDHVDDLFCVNERLVTYVDSPLGEVATIMVGATSVGHITTAYDPGMQTNQGRDLGRVAYSPGLRIARADELGVFNLGSTAIVLFANPAVEITESEPGAAVRMGRCIARQGDARSGDSQK